MCAHTLACHTCRAPTMRVAGMSCDERGTAIIKHVFSCFQTDPTGAVVITESFTQTESFYMNQHQFIIAISTLGGFRRVRIDGSEKQLRRLVQQWRADPEAKFPIYTLADVFTPLGSGALSIYFTTIKTLLSYDVIFHIVDHEMISESNKYACMRAFRPATATMAAAKATVLLCPFWPDNDESIRVEMTTLYNSHSSIHNIFPPRTTYTPPLINYTDFTYSFDVGELKKVEARKLIESPAVKHDRVLNMVKFNHFSIFSQYKCNLEIEKVVNQLCRLQKVQTVILVSEFKQFHEYLARAYANGGAGFGTEVVLLTLQMILDIDFTYTGNCSNVVVIFVDRFFSNFIADMCVDILNQKCSILETLRFTWCVDACTMSSEEFIINPPLKKCIESLKMFA